jgi:hypothetical protein
MENNANRAPAIIVKNCDAMVKMLVTEFTTETEVNG